MLLTELLSQRGISKYSLAKSSGVPYTTLNDICSGKTHLAKCSAETVYRLAKDLHVSMEELLDPYLEKRCSFELFKSNVCHRLKRLGDLDFIIDVLEKDEIQKYYDKKWYPECFYLLAMVDYISRVNHIDLCSDYDELRKQKLGEIIYPAGVIVLSLTEESDEPKKEALREAIPEFLRYNIVESEVRNVV
jgi:plasmid maintenance system antidote protein VapI